MGTRFVISTYGDETKAKSAADLAFRRAEEINQCASDYIADSELLRLSKLPAHQPIVVSATLFDLLTQSLHFAKITEGRFDPTLGPLTYLWRQSRRNGALPSNEILHAAQQACGWKNVELDPNKKTITLLKNNMRFDLGGIAKGYAADAMLAIMQQHQFSRSCITAGGDLRIGESPPGKIGWSVGVKTFHPSQLAETKELSHCAVSTSGDLHQSIEINGVHYAHIVDPKTGLGLTTHRAVTIIAPNATTSDALATAACVAEPAQAEALAKQWGATTAISAMQP
jgi:thiamine biosynthesis lipoprotein